ncbi:hypothetical protein [Kitasatospora sp. NPDC059571]|uniref:hypothetical protein n=1 Tax=Kitasatospora sp. NPDC059571 TaxID=3346871 RepID=UPI0036CB4879
MRPTWTAAALTAALAIPAVTLATAAPASAVDPDAVLLRLSRPAVAAPPRPAAAPTVPDPSAPAVPSTPSLPGVPALPSVPSPPVPAVSGLLDGVLGLLDGVVALAAPPSGTPDPAALQQKVDELVAAVKALLAGLPIQVPALRTP